MTFAPASIVINPRPDIIMSFFPYQFQDVQLLYHSYRSGQDYLVVLKHFQFDFAINH